MFTVELYNEIEKPDSLWIPLFYLIQGVFLSSNYA